MSTDSFSELLEQGLGSQIPVEYPESQTRAHASRKEALGRLRRLHEYIGWTLLASAATGAYLLATDQSIWILATSHAVGLAMIVFLDVVLGILGLAGWRRAYLPSLAAAFLGIVLQLGDITTGPQYGMSMSYFASYLFGLVAFDALLILQGLVLILGVTGRTSAETLATRGRMRRELNYNRRSFITTIVGFGALVGFAVALGSVKISGGSSPSNGQVASTTTPITNTSNLQVDSPVYFEYPSGYPNVLFKRSDGTLAAYSMLCTHVCCETTYEASASVFYCPCHGSEFDSSGNVLRGPAAEPLPMITLTVDSSGDIYPSGTSGATPC